METKMNVTVKGNKMTIEIDLTEPKLSKGGKLELVASTGGFQTTEAKIADGRVIKLNVTAGVSVK